jgi:hypothetical protein
MVLERPAPPRFGLRAGWRVRTVAAAAAITLLGACAAVVSSVGQSANAAVAAQAAAAAPLRTKFLLGVWEQCPDQLAWWKGLGVNTAVEVPQGTNQCPGYGTTVATLAPSMTT